MSCLAIEPLTREAFAAFGAAIMLEGAEHYPINSGTTEHFHALAGIDACAQGGQPVISLYRGQPQALPLPITIMERHPMGSQAFIPVTQSEDDEYLVVVAPPGEFSVGKLKAFLARGFQGVSYARGVWHHPLIALHRVADFVVVDRIGEGNNCDEIALDGGIVLTAEAVAAARLS